MINLHFELDLSSKEITEAINIRFKAAVNNLFQAASNEAQRIAAQRLEKGLKHWVKGFQAFKVTDGFYIISVEGLLANWMEDGASAREVSNRLLHGNRANYNAAKHGTRFVDVPLETTADASGNFRGTKSPVNIQKFRNADELMKSIEVSDWKRKSGGTRKQERIVSRVQDIIKSTHPHTGSTTFLTIRRVSEENPWPRNPIRGAKVLDEVQEYIINNFDRIIEEAF